MLRAAVVLVSDGDHRTSRASGVFVTVGHESPKVAVRNAGP